MLNGYSKIVDIQTEYGLVLCLRAWSLLIKCGHKLLPSKLGLLVNSVFRFVKWS